MARRITVSGLDRIFSKCIREQYDWICAYENCEYCGNHSFRDHPGGLHNSHYRGRRNRSVRWAPDNCFALCHQRHQRMGDCPDEHTAWVRSQLGDVRFDDLVIRANGHRKYTPDDRREMYDHYKAQLEYMYRRRMEGEQGYLPLVRWD